MAARRKKVIKKLEKPATARVKGGKKTATRGTNAGRGWLKRPKNVTDDDVRYVVERGVDEAESLLESAQHWLVNLAKRVRMLYDMLVAWWTGRFDFPKSTVAAITLALLYFINPFDLIPDELPVIGVLDDAMVLAFVTRMMQDDLRRYAKKFGLKLSEVGLADEPRRKR